MDRVAPCQGVSAEAPYQGQQGLPYAAAVSAETVGSRGLWLGLVTIPPGGRTRAHLHRDHESAISVLAGESECWYGPRPGGVLVTRRGDIVYVPAGTPHVAVNRSPTEPCRVVIARTDPHDQESVVLLPELDGRVP